MGTAYAQMPLEEVVRSSYASITTRAIFNNAAQHWNHCAFWLSMKPGGGDKIPFFLEQRLAAQFGSINAFKAEFIAQGMAQFGAGWVWLVEAAGVLRIEKSPNAVTPIVTGNVPLLAIFGSMPITSTMRTGGPGFWRLSWNLSSIGMRCWAA